MKTVAAVTGVRRGSQRVPGKNFRPFAGSSLFEIKVRQLLRVPGVARVYVSSNDEQALGLAESLGATPLVRPDELCTDAAGISQFAPYFARQVSEDAILYTLVTCPLIEPDTYGRAIQEFLELDGTRYDSLCSFEVLKAFLWRDGKPFNYDPANQPRSQDLPSMHAFHPGITIMDRERIQELRNVVGTRPKQFPLNPHETADVDYPIDFFIAERLYEEIVVRGNRSLCNER